MRSLRDSLIFALKSEMLDGRHIPETLMKETVSDQPNEGNGE